jgi:hypothetical protein
MSLLSRGNAQNQRGAGGVEGRELNGSTLSRDERSCTFSSRTFRHILVPLHTDVCMIDMCILDR